MPQRGLAILSFTGHVTPTVLLAAAFLLSVGSAMSSPPFQAVVPDLVSKAELGPAVALNSLGVNISPRHRPGAGGLFALAGRAVDGVHAQCPVGAGRRLGAVALEACGLGATPAHRSTFSRPVRAGVRYVHAAPVLRNVLIRTVAFFVFASAGWALLPLVARRELGLGPAGYGIMLACIGLGAIAGAVLLPRLRQRLNADQLMVGGGAWSLLSPCWLWPSCATSGC
ncbi:enterobactin exporter EntS [Leclercia adecarboxylata]|uniref:Enterobactin exporter EntS n=1 Tax=Leclercia adecarboxylata TaxID=83655 RepID=A0A4U9HLZ9_9ENTR|nr:enterobactin exporter EntS [Leclercia adecarboxylata]